MDVITELKESLAKEIKIGQDILKECREKKIMVPDAETKEKYDKSVVTITEIRERLKMETDAEKNRLELELIEARVADPDDPGAKKPEDRKLDAKETREKKTADESRAFGHYLQGEYGPGLSIEDGKVLTSMNEERRDLVAGSDVKGGYTLAPMEFVAGLIKTMDLKSVIRSISKVHTNVGYAGLGMTSLDTDLGDPEWTTELDPGSEDTSMEFGRRELRPNPLRRWIRVSKTLLRNSPQVEGYVRDAFARKFRYVEETAHILGNGDKRPLGLMVASDDGISTDQDVSDGNEKTYATFEGLKRAKYALPSGYWPEANWVFHTDAMMIIDLLEDNQGRPLLQPDLVSPTGQLILGVPVQISDFMPSTFTQGLYFGIIGAFQNYEIADSVNMSIEVTNDLFIRTNQIGFFADMESDAMPTLQEAFIRIQLGS